MASEASVALQRQTDEAFRNLLQNPTDVSTTTDYVTLLLRAGNYEGAIAALERLLVLPGAPASLRIEIAALYAQLRSYTVAESLLNEALADRSLSDADRARAQALLGQVRAAGATSRFSGVLIMGLRQQSNPTFRTDAPQIFSNGALVNNTIRPASDSDASLGLRLQHEYDLGFKDYAALSSSGGVFLVQSNAASGRPIVAGYSSPYNLLVLDGNSGVVFRPLSSHRQLSVRPHVLGSSVQAQGAQYLTSLGLGLDVNYALSNTTGLFATLDSQRREFASRADVPAASQLNGQITSLRLRWLQSVAANQVLNAEITFRQSRAGRDFYSFSAVEPRVSYAVSYPGWFGSGSWTTTPYIAHVQRSYRGADAAVNANFARRDSEWRVGLTHSMPVTPRWTLLVTAEQVRNNANLPNFSFKNTSFGTSLIFSF